MASEVNVEYNCKVKSPEFSPLDPKLIEASLVSKFYDGKTIFITGASGFMGKVLVEKLLYACPGIIKIYILMRPRHEKGAELRLQTFLESKVFVRQTPESLKKIVAIAGDISLSELGLSAEDKATLQNEVSVVFHSAATVRFHEPLMKSLNINLMGTKRVVELARGMTNLKAFVHVSTCYAHCDRDDVIEEKIYPNPRNIRSQNIIKAMEWMDEKMLETLSRHLTAGRPNTYTLTKAITETYIQDEALPTLPAVAIVRPSVVTASWREPVPGWVDSLNGVTGAYLSAYIGLMKAVKIDRSVVGDFVPVDMVINLMIVVAWKIANGVKSKASLESERNLMIYNCSSNGTNPLYWSTIEDVSRVAGMSWPSIDTLRYPSFVSYSSKKSRYSLSHLVYLMDLFFRHHVPAVVVDLYSNFRGPKTRFREYLDKTLKGSDALNYFSAKDWKFDTSNVSELNVSLDASDRNLFNFDINSVNWPAAIESHVLGMRRYILNEDDNNLDRAKRRLKTLRYVDLALSLVLWGSLTVGLFFLTNWSFGTRLVHP